MRFMYRTLLLLMVTVGLTAQQKPATKAPAPQKPPVAAATKKPVAPAVPRMSAKLVEAIQELAKTRSYMDFLGVTDYQFGSRRLAINSVRSSLAFATARAAEGGGKFRATASYMLDTVSIVCGDHDLGDIFECTSLRVLTPDGKVLKPVGYGAVRNAYKNALGHRWVVREVEASYLAFPLRKGFTVEYVSPDGTEWTYQATTDDAYELLLTVTEDGQLPTID